MRRPRAFWEARIAELERGKSVEDVARMHRLDPVRLRWWRWHLGRTSAPEVTPRLVELIAAPSAPSGGVLRVLIGSAVVELPTTTTPEFIGQMLRAFHVAC